MSEPIKARRWQDFSDRIQQIDSCLIWTGPLNKDGYGQLYGYGGYWVANRRAYERAKGPVPAGLQLDHLCRNRACVNPDHLEAVTCRVNLLRGDTIPAHHAAATACPSGHPYDEGNTYHDPRGKRGCRICRRAAYQGWRERKKGMVA